MTSRLREHKQHDALCESNVRTCTYFTLSLAIVLSQHRIPRGLRRINWRSSRGSDVELAANRLGHVSPNAASIAARYAQQLLQMACLYLAFAAQTLSLLWLRQKGTAKRLSFWTPPRRCHNRISVDKGSGSVPFRVCASTLGSTCFHCHAHRQRLGLV